MSNRPFRAVVLTISDSAFRGEREDRSGPAATEFLIGIGGDVVRSEILPDVRSVIADRLATLADSFPQVRILDIGGGLGVAHEPGDLPLILADLDAALLAVKALYPRFELWIEPGRYLVAEAGVLITRVTQLKLKSGVRFLGVDAGMHTLLRPALYDAWHEVRNLSRSGEPDEGRWQVVGPICESSDVLARDRLLPRAQTGDVMLIANAGAYGASMASRYNSRLAPLEVFREDL